MRRWAGAHKGQANQVMVDYTGVKESNAIFAAKFKCLSLLLALVLEPFLSQPACARVIEMGRDRPVGSRIKLLTHCSKSYTENLNAAHIFSWPNR